MHLAQDAADQSPHDAIQPNARNRCLHQPGYNRNDQDGGTPSAHFWLIDFPTLIRFS